METLSAQEVEAMSAEEFYRFLHDEYFVWKYTAPNRLASTRMHLQKHTAEWENLRRIHSELFSMDTRDIRAGLKIASQIRGLGIAGASGLLALLFPEHFATVDQFVVKSLLMVGEIEERSRLLAMNPLGLTISDGVFLIQTMAGKAQALNRKNSRNDWTPRRVDKVLWTVSHK